MQCFSLFTAIWLCLWWWYWDHHNLLTLQIKDLIFTICWRHGWWQNACSMECKLVIVDLSCYNRSMHVAMQHDFCYQPCSSWCWNLASPNRISCIDKDYMLFCFLLLPMTSTSSTCMPHFTSLHTLSHGHVSRVHICMPVLRQFKLLTILHNNV